MFLGMFFKPSFKYLKNKKNNFSQAILKLETLLYQNLYYIHRAILIQKKKSQKNSLREKKTSHIKVSQN